MSNIQSLFQGDSSSLIAVRPDLKNPTDVINSDWVCKTTLLSADKSVIIPTRVETTKSDDGLTWIVGLSPSDTAQVVVNGKFEKCKWIIQVENLTLSPAYRREKHIQVNVKKQGIQDA